MNKEIVLIAEDEEINRGIVKSFLKKEYEVLEVCNGQEALECIEEHPEIGLVLLDLHMPVKDGFQVMKEMYKVRDLTIPVIVMTAQDDIATEEKALKAGAVDFVSKPVNPHILIRRVRNAMVRNQMIILKQMEYLVSHDELTGLYNRSKLFAATRDMMDEHPDVQFVFVRFDIDKFRLYNSAMGENEGNKLLCYMAKLIEGMAADYKFGTYGRVDADVFCMCVPYHEKILKRHIRYTQTVLEDYRDDYDIDTSFGIYIIDDPTLNLETIFTRSSLASDRCKNLYDIHYAYYERSMSDQIDEIQEITNDMRTALREEQFVVYLQPKYNIKTDTPCGAEALVRWMHPKKGMISPAKFIPVFENNGFIADLDHYMWEHVCMIMSQWIKNGETVAPISVNMSRVSLMNAHVTDFLIQLMKKYEIPIELFQLEVTESAYMSDPESMAGTISKLHDAGFVILMDDFGSGYSSLNTLKEIEIDVLKLDMKFMSVGGDEVKSEKILSAIVRMAGWLGMDVIAEGVETYEQKQFLESIGCSYVQGYFYAKPMPVEDYERLMRGTRSEAQEKITRQENKEFADAFWSANPMIEELISGLDLPVTILEYAPNYTGIVRANKAFIDTYGDVGNIANMKIKPENVDIIKQLLDEATETGHPVVCDLASNRGGKKSWVRIKARRIAQITKAAILLCSYEDVTKEREYELEMNRIENMLNTESAKKKMLIVDDVKMCRKELIDLFGKEYEIIEANNGKKGLNLLEKYGDEIEVILLDMVMPKMGGKEFLEHKNNNPKIAKIPVVVISSEEDKSIQIDMLRNGVNDYITKPFIPEITKKRVENVLVYKSRFSKLIKEYRKEKQ